MKLALRQRRGEQGFVMLIMLAVLLLLLVVASLMFTRASAGVQASASLKRQSLAQDRALTGMQRAYAEINATVPSAAYAAFDGDTTNDCIDPIPDTCPPNPLFMRVYKNNGTVLTLDNGGGYQWAYEYFWWNAGGLPIPPGERLRVIRAFGYVGFAAPPSQATMESEVLLEVGSGTSSATTSGPGGTGYSGN